MNTETKIVIVGAGQAGAELATSLRQQGHKGRIVMIGDEEHLPYRRPPLSKAYLTGEITADSLLIKPASTYEKFGIELRIPARVSCIDRESKNVIYSDGAQESYDRLVLATGGQARKLNNAGSDSSNIFTLRSLNDVEVIRTRLNTCNKLVVIGGGYVGLELAASARKLGVQVAVLEGASRLLVRVTAPEMSSFYQRVHTERGVEILTNVVIDKFESVGSNATSVILKDGRRLEADLFVVGIGLTPNVELANAAGLEVADGIVVDEFGQTIDPNIYSIGDSTNQPNAWLGRSVRVESVPNAMDQARNLAGVLCGKPKPFSSVPWFWSDQYDLKLQMVGLSQGYDQLVMRGSPESNSFCTFYLSSHRIIAVDAVNRASEFMVAKRLVAERVEADPTSLEDDSKPLQSLFPITSSVAQAI